MSLTRTTYSAALSALLPEALPTLGRATPNTALRQRLAALNVATAFGSATVADESAARCCLAGLWLVHDFLDESHAISQEIENPDGSYWHAIMHRREPDYWNSKYWFRRVGRHAIFAPLADEARQLAAKCTVDKPAEFLARPGDWDPFRLVDLCEAIAEGKSRCERLAREVARAEWRLLFDHCYRAALGHA